MILVIDADNFFVSCEKLFEPKLNGKPAVVLSNNDGCIVARSIEAKAIGIPMGAPLFQVKDRLQKEGVHIFSGNFSLYCDLSDRMMAILRNYTDNLEIYSIDEAFATLDHIPQRELEQFGEEIRNRIYKEVGITVSVGIAPTKTLAKIATHVVKDAKKAYVKAFFGQHTRFPYIHELEMATSGVCVLTIDDKLDQRLTETDVGEIWGIGRNLADRLHRLGITTCKKLRDAPYEIIKKSLGVNGLKTQKELRGDICFHVSQKHSIPKSVMNTRSFGRVVTQHNELNEAITRYTAELSEKLRRYEICATFLTIYITTKKYDKHYYSKTLTSNFVEPTNSSRIMITEAQSLLREAFRSGYSYRKAGVIVSGIIKQNAIPTNLFVPIDPLPTPIDQALDATNGKFGKGSLVVTSAGIAPQWRMKINIRSPRYTTALSEIPRVK